MARFIHIGDLHLGPNSRNVDRRNALDQIIREAPRPIAAWLIPGDLNDGRMTIDDRNWLSVRLRTMADEAPVLMCYGNHDLPGDLDVFALLGTVWPIRVLSRPQTVCFALPGGERAAVFVLPYPTRAGLVGAGVPSEQVVEAARQALDVIFMGAAAELREATASGHIPLMIGHVNVAGSITSSGQPNIGKEIELDEALLDRLGRIYKGLNHIHKRQQYYAGSVCRLDWGEIEEKSYVEIVYEPGATYAGFNGDGPEDGEPDGWAFDTRLHKIDIAPLYHVEGELTREGFRWWITKSEDGAEGQAPMRDCPTCGHLSDVPFCSACDGSGRIASWDGCEVRVRYRFNADERTALDESLVRAPFEGAKRLETDPIAVRNRASRAPEVAAAVTLDGKVEAFIEQSGRRWSPSLAAKLAGLQKPDGAAFLTDVSNGLSEAVDPVSEARRSGSPSADPPVGRAHPDAASGKELTGVLL